MLSKCQDSVFLLCECSMAVSILRVISCACRICIHNVGISEEVMKVA